MSKFDLKSARAAGYSDTEILEGLAKQKADFDLNAARQAGYDDSKILEGLADHEFRVTTWEKVKGAVTDVVAPDAPDVEQPAAPTSKPSAESKAPAFRGSGASGSWDEPAASKPVAASGLTVAKGRGGAFSKPAEPSATKTKPAATAKPAPSLTQADKIVSDKLRSTQGDPAQVATDAMRIEARKIVPMTVKPGQEVNWLKKNNPKALAKLQSGVGKKAADAEIKRGAASLDATIEKQNTDNQAAIDAEKESPKLANLKSSIFQASGGLYGALSATAAALAPEGKDGFSADKLREISTKHKAWADAIASESSKQNFRDAESKLGWMTDQFLLNAPSTAVTLASIFSPASAPLALGAMATYAGGGHYTELINAGVDNKTATLAAVGYGAVEAAIERAIPVELGQQVLKKFKALPMLEQAKMGQRIVRGVVAGGAAGTAMLGTEGAEELVTGAIQRSIDKAVRAKMLADGNTDAAAKVGKEGVYNPDAMINDFMGGVAGGAPVAGAVGGYGGMQAAQSREGAFARELNRAIEGSTYSVPPGPGAGPGAAEYSDAAARAFGKAPSQPFAAGLAAAESGPIQGDGRIDPSFNGEPPIQGGSSEPVFGGQAPDIALSPADLSVARAINPEIAPQGGLTRAAKVAAETGLTQQIAEQNAALEAADLLDDGGDDARSGADAGVAGTGVKGGNLVEPGGAGNTLPQSGIAVVEHADTRAGSLVGSAGSPVAAGITLSGDPALSKPEKGGQAEAPTEKPATLTAAGQPGETPVPQASGLTMTHTPATGKSAQPTEGGEAMKPIGEAGKPVDEALGQRPVVTMPHKGDKGGKEPEEKPAVLARVGTTPNNTEDVTVRDGVVYLGDYPAQNFESGENIVVKKDATVEDVRNALKQNGAITNRQRVYAATPNPTATDAKPIEVTGGVRYPNRKLGFSMAATRIEDKHSDMAMANVALSNLQPGEKIVIGRGPEMELTVDKVGDKAISFVDGNGKKQRYEPGSKRWEPFTRNVGGAILGSQHGVDTGDLRKALMRDPAFVIENGVIGLVDKVIESAKTEPTALAAAMKQHAKGAKAKKKRALPPAKDAEEFGQRARKEFLKHIKDMGGIKTEEARDVSGEPAHIANRMLPGLFRTGGNALDLITRRLNELGYLSDEAYNDVDGGVQVVRDMIGEALNGNPVMTSEDDQRHTEMTERENALKYEASNPVEVDAIAEDGSDELADDVTAELDHDEIAGLENDFLPGFDGPAKPMDEADAMRAMGFSEDEIKEALNGQGNQEAATGDRGQADEAVTKGQANRPATDGREDQDEGFGLQAQTEQGLNDADRRRQQAAADKAKADADSDARAKADAERGTFSLTGSSRAADANPGQADIFGQPSKLDAAAASIDDELDAALKELADALKKQSGSLNSGVDPAILALGVKVGSLYVAKGVVKFAQYSKAIIDALRAHGVSADQIKPYLKQFYAATKQAVDDATFERMDDDRTVRGFDLDAQEAKPAQATVKDSLPVGDTSEAEQQPAMHATRELAPGTRVNGEAERKAANRLETLAAIMEGKGFAANTPEWFAAREVKSIIEELRKDRNHGSVREILEVASSRLMSKYQAFSQVIDEVIESIDTRAPTEAKAEAATETGPIEKIVGDKLETNLPEAEYITKKGKTLKGVITKTLTLEQAKTVDKFAWKHGGGIFVRMQHVVRPEAAQAPAVEKTEDAPLVSKNAAEIRKFGAEAFKNGEKRVPPSFMAAASQKEWLAGWDAANVAAPVEQETKNPATFDEFMRDIEAGYETHYDYAGVDGRTLWIEKVGGRGWVMKSQDDGQPGITSTKGGAGLSSWDKLDALKAVEREIEYRFKQWKPLVDKAGAPATNKAQEAIQDDAGNLPEESVPAGRAESNPQRQHDGDRTGEPLDAGLAGTGQGTAGAGGVSGGVRAATEPGNGRAVRIDGDTPGTDGNNRGGRAGDGAADHQLDHTISDEDGIGDGGLGAKYRDNIAAIKIIKGMETFGRVATPDERKKLARYVGWGALKGVFDPNNKTWAKQHVELKALLTDVEWESALSSIRNAHYTSPTVIKAMYEAIDQLGFKGGRILEPSMGSGNFFGLMPAAMRGQSKLHGVELDNLTSRLAQALYPNAVIAASTGFQSYQVPSGYFDMAYGNPPFGSELIVDRERSEYSGFSIHNYFIARMIDKTRDGGIVPVIVSHSFMDAMSPKAREWVSRRANLLGAVRLPETAFKNNAGTEVVTDILFFQKTATPEKTPAWVNATDVALVNPKTGEGANVFVNDYFSANPRNVLGRESLGGTMYSPNSYTVEPTGDLAEQLQAFVNTLPANVYQPIEHPTEELASADNTVPDGIKPGSYYVNEQGAVRQRGNDVAGMKVSSAWEAANAGADKRMRAMIQLRDLLRWQMRAELSNDTPQDAIESGRAALNKAYDAFVKANGYLNSQINRRIFLDDTESALVQALEFDYDAGISKARAEASGLEEKKPSATKADIMQRRVLFPPSTEIKVSNAQDAMLASLNEKGRVDMAFMATAYGKTESQIADELGDLLFEDPQAGYVTADEYLSGDVKTKLTEARAAAATDERFERNEIALEKVIPVDKMPSEIFASIGANWIPNDVYEQFAEDITGSKSVKTSYLAATAQWFANMEGGSDAGKMSSDYGTDRISSFEIFKLMLNGRAVEVKKKSVDGDGKERYVTDEAATEAARQRLDKIKQHWDSWVWNDGPRAERLANIYNEKHNRTVKRGFDGSHMSMPGMSPTLTLRQHQKNVIWRATQDRNVLMDHVVGAGKTYAMVGTIMEMKRLGIARKPLFVVPNHLTLQWRSDFSRLYPAANVLAATPEDFSKDNRERMFAKIATGEYDAVVVGHSSLKKIGLDPEIEQRFLKEQLDEIADAIEEMKKGRGDKAIVRDMEKIKKNLEAKIESIVQKAGERDKVVTFNELGIDALIVDEMHEFKNLFFYTQKQRVSGLGNPKGSGKAFDLFMKIRWMQDAIGDNAPLITATGTPVSNSLSEMFTMQRFMRFNELKGQGLHLFDSWSRMYGEDEYVYEVAPSGVGYRISQRFSKFKNLPSLMGHYQSFADVVTLQDLKDQAASEGQRFPVPKMEGGRQQNIVAKRSDLQRDFFGVPVVRRDEATGEIVFEINDPAQWRIERNDDSKDVNTAITLTDGDTATYHATHEDAALALAEKAMTPVLDLDPNSLVGQFNNLRQLTRETKGKINALSLTGLASKAGLDYRLINPAAPDFAGSKINRAVDKMVEKYRQWEADKGTQLVFCDLSVPLSAKAAAAKNEKRLYVLDDAGMLTHKKGTLHTVEGFEGFPFYLVRTGKGTNASVSVYEPMSGQLLRGGMADKDAAKAWAAKMLETENGRDKWYDVREKVEAITPERIIDYRDEKGLEVDEEGSNEISMDDLEAMSG